LYRRILVTSRGERNTCFLSDRGQVFLIRKCGKAKGSERGGYGYNQRVGLDAVVEGKRKGALEKRNLLGKKERNWELRVRKCF